MVKKISNTRKVINWIFDIPYEYRKTKQRWQRQSALAKILSLLLVFALLAVSCFIFYWTGKAFNALSGRDLEAIIKSLILFIGIMCLVIIDLVFIVNMYRQLIFNAMVAFVCRPAKNSKIQNKPAEASEPQTTDQNISEDQTNTDDAINDQAKTLSPEDLKQQPKSKTSRTFDTIIGWINIALIVIYTAGLFFSFAGGYGR